MLCVGSKIEVFNSPGDMKVYAYTRAVKAAIQQRFSIASSSPASLCGENNLSPQRHAKLREPTTIF